jgi:hypothetical protein
MIKPDNGPSTARLQAAFTALESKLKADGLTATTTAAEKARLQDELKPLSEARSKVSNLVAAAKNITFPGMSEEQQAKARVALDAAKALDQSTTALAADSTAYGRAAQLCDTLLQLCLGVEKTLSGYKSQYTWNYPGSSSYSSDNASAQLGRIQSLRQLAQQSKDNVVKRAVEAHGAELDAVATAAAEVALVDALRLGFQFLLLETKTDDAISTLRSLVSNAARYASDAALAEHLPRMVQMATAIVHHNKGTVADYTAKAADPFYLDAATFARVQAAFAHLAANPSTIGDPADFFVSQWELQKAAGLEGGSVNDELPPRPDIPASEVAAMIKAMAAGFVIYPTH